MRNSLLALELLCLQDSLIRTKGGLVVVLLHCCFNSYVYYIAAAFKSPLLCVLKARPMERTTNDAMFNYDTVRDLVLYHYL